MNTHPPRAAEWLLTRLLDDEARESVAGDLEEEYRRVAQRSGAAAASRWYWQAVVRSIVACRVTGHRVPDARRFDYEAGARASLRDLLRPALRQFKDQPLYSVACVLTLALAVGAACVSFAVVKRAFIDPLPYRADHELVSLLTSVDGAVSAVSPHVLADLRESNPPFVEFAPIRPTGVAYTVAGATETLGVSFVGLDYFAMLGVSPALGRVWTPQEPDAIVVSGAFWRDKLGSDPSAVGSSIVVEGRPRVVVGIMPADFMPPYFQATDAWAPIDMPALLADLRARRTLTILARRAPGATQQDVDAYLALFSTQLQERFPEHRGQTWVARPLRDELVGSSRPALLGTAAASALLLLIVGASIAGLSTAQTIAVRHQLVVRAALGATRGRLFSEHLAESAVLALIGSIAGVWIAYGLVTVVDGYQQFFLPRLSPITLDGVSVAVAVVSGVVIGLAAMLVPRMAIGTAPAEVLRSARGSAGSVKVTTTRAALVVAQVAIALVLLVGAGLLVRTVQHLSQRDLGFDSRGLTWMQVNLPGTRYQPPEAQIQFERDVVERLRQIPGVKSAMASVGFPLWGGMMAGLYITGDPPGTPRGEIAYLSVSPNFVADVGARILAGRDLQPTDTYNTTRVVVINETMARMFWPEGNAIGTEVKIGAGSPNDRWITIVGVMADMRAHGLTETIRPTAFGTTHQYTWPRRHLAVRTEIASATLATELRSAIQAVDPSVSLGAVASSGQVLANSMARPRLVMLALSLFGGVALALCISGLYAVIVLSSQQRRREYAIRVALGARRGGVRWMVVRQALTMAGIGAAVGLGAAALATRALQGLLHGVQPLDTLTFAVAAVTVLALAVMAAWYPASQAERVNPVETLRAE
jgi:putative ABC transport system permease protein